MTGSGDTDPVGSIKTSSGTGSGGDPGIADLPNELLDDELANGDREQSLAVARYLKDLEQARRSSRQIVEDTVSSILKMLQERDEIDQRLDDLMASINGKGPRRHNVITVAWVLRRDRIGTSISNPSGPEFYHVIQPRRGGRFKNKIPRLTVEACKAAFQGKDSGELMRLAKEISALVERRNLINKRFTAVRKSLQHV